MGENDFGWALAQMREGHRVRRRGWMPEESIGIGKIFGKTDIIDEDGSRCSFRDNLPLLATDWEIAA